MARPKSHSAESPSGAAIENDSNNNDALIRQLLEKINDLEKRLDEKSNVQLPNNNSIEIEDQDSFEKYKINQDDYIKVVSLCDRKLNLCVEKFGRGRVYSFSHFGEVKRIIYSDLVKILDTNTAFLNAGYFYIMDQRCIHRHGLDDLYENILSKESIEKILDGKSNDVVSLFKSTNLDQQHIITEMLINKLIKDPDSLDLNLIDKISRASGIKIQEKAEEAREYMMLDKQKKEDEEQ